MKLSQIVRTKHDEKAESDKKVLGLNILTQLQQKLRTDDDIKAFAIKIVNQSGVFLKLNNDQMQLHLRNNENDKSPTNPASINKKTILVSIPSPDDNEGLKRFADKLERAFLDSFNQSTARTTIVVNRKSPRKDELSIITVAYCFPMRCIEWMQPYKERYERFLHTGNAATDTCNAILLHTEGDGSLLPSLFAVNKPQETTGAVPPPVNPSTPPPIMPQEPEIILYIAVGGQQYGPYNRDMCKQMVKSGQLTPNSMVWMEGMAQWSAASQVASLQSLFLPPSPSAMPPMPPTSGSTPPPMI